MKFYFRIPASGTVGSNCQFHQLKPFPMERMDASIGGWEHAFAPSKMEGDGILPADTDAMHLPKMSHPATPLDIPATTAVRSQLAQLSQTSPLAARDRNTLEWAPATAPETSRSHTSLLRQPPNTSATSRHVRCVGSIACMICAHVYTAQAREHTSARFKISSSSRRYSIANSPCRQQY